MLAYIFLQHGGWQAVQLRRTVKTEINTTQASLMWLICMEAGLPAQ